MRLLQTSAEETEAIVQEMDRSADEEDEPPQQDSETEASSVASSSVDPPSPASEQADESVDAATHDKQDNRCCLLHTFAHDRALCVAVIGAFIKTAWSLSSDKMVWPIPWSLDGLTACVVSRDQLKASKQRAARGVRFHPSLSAVSEISLESDQSEQADSATLRSPFQAYADRGGSAQPAQVARTCKQRSPTFRCFTLHFHSSQRDQAVANAAALTCCEDIRWSSH